MSSHSYRTKQLLLSILILLVFSVVIIVLLPPRKGPLSMEDKILILEVLESRSVSQASISERREVLNKLAERSITSKQILVAEEDKLKILESLQE